MRSSRGRSRDPCGRPRHRSWAVAPRQSCDSTRATRCATSHCQAGEVGLTSYCMRKRRSSTGFRREETGMAPEAAEFRLDRAAGGRAEVLRRRACAARHRHRDRPQRDRRPDRRQRRRQVDADQGHDRRARADRGQDLHPRPRNPAAATIRCAWRTISRSRPSIRTSRSPRSSRCGAISSSAGRSPTASASSTSSARRRSPSRS